MTGYYPLVVHVIVTVKRFGAEVELVYFGKFVVCHGFERGFTFFGRQQFAVVVNSRLLFGMLTEPERIPYTDVFRIRLITRRLGEISAESVRADGIHHSVLCGSEISVVFYPSVGRRRRIFVIGIIFHRTPRESERSQNEGNNNA